MTSELPQSSMMSATMPHPMMPPNGFIGYPGMMPSTSNNMMSNFSMDDTMRNSGSPMMMQQQAQNSPLLGGPGPSSNFGIPAHPGNLQQFSSSMPSFHSQNQQQYSSNGPPPQSQQFQNPNIPPHPSQQYFPNQQQQQQQQQMPTTASPSRLNTPNYPPSNASNANNTPTYPPNHAGTPTYPNAPNMQQNNPSSYPNNGSQIQNFNQMSADFLQQTPDGNTSSNSDILSQPLEENGFNSSNNNNNFMNRDMNNFQGPGGPMPPPNFQRQMSSNMMNNASMKKTNSNKTFLFNSEMLNEIPISNPKDVNAIESWHSIHHPQSNGSAKNNRKRKMESPSFPSSDFPVSMGDFNSPMSNNSLTDLSGGNPMLNGASMPPDAFGIKRDRKDDDNPLLQIERMTQQTLDSPKINNRVENRKQDDKNKKMAKLDSIANDLNLAPAEYIRPMLPPGMQPQGLPPGFHPMMHQMPGRPPFPPGAFDPNMPPNMGMPNGQMRMPFPPGHPMNSQFPPNFMPPNSQNGMMTPYGMPSASPKFPQMMNQPPIMSPQQGNMPIYPGMRPPMNDPMWRQQMMQMQQQQQQQQNGQMPLQ